MVVHDVLGTVALLCCVRRNRFLFRFQAMKFEVLFLFCLVEQDTVMVYMGS